MQWLILLPVLILSVVLHELAHAWVARREGDDTAERLGRITLNPIPHLDPIGSIIVPAILAAAPGGFIFGWAKPVPVDRSKVTTGVWGDIRISLAGIAVNLLLAVAFAILTVPLLALTGGDRSSPFDVLITVAYYGVVINLILAVFNLIPVPPLDGSHVLAHMLPEPLRKPYVAIGSIGGLVLIGVLFLVPGAFGIIMGPVDFMADFLFSLVGVRGRL